MKKILFIFILGFLFLTARNAAAQIMVTDPISIGIQSIIQKITAANEMIQAAESKIEVELSALKYVRQGQQLMNQIQNLQQESSQLIGAVNNIEGTVMMPAAQLAGLKNSLTAEQTSMSNIIAQEQSNPALAAYMQNYQNTYGNYGAVNASPGAYASGVYNQYTTANIQAMQTGAYAQSILNNAQTNQNLISQLGANVAAAHGSVSAQQATGQAVVALTEEVNQTNKLLAEQAKLAAVQAGTKDSAQASSAGNAAAIGIATPPTPPPATGNGGFGVYPAVTNFGLGK